jgi:hypothetical protein
MVCSSCSRSPEVGSAENGPSRWHTCKRDRQEG